MSLHATLSPLSDQFRVGNYKAHLSFLSPTAIQEIKTILSTNPKDRTDEILNIFNPVANAVEVFRSLGIQHRRQIFRVSTLQELQEEEIVFLQGDQGDAMYIIIEGICDVYINHGGYSAPKKMQSCRQLNFNHVAKVGELGPLQWFGHIALDSENCERTASVIVKESCSLLKVDRAAYKLANCYYFNECPQKELETATRIFVSRSFTPGTILLREGDKHGEIFLIRTGFCRILKKCPNQNLVLELGEVGKFSIIGHRESCHSSPTLEFSLIASSYLEVFMVKKSNLYVFLSECPVLRNNMKLYSTLPMITSMSTLMNNLNKSIKWENYKLRLCQELVPVHRLKIPEKKKAILDSPTKPPQPVQKNIIHHRKTVLLSHQKTGDASSIFLSNKMTGSSKQQLSFHLPQLLPPLP